MNTYRDQLPQLGNKLFLTDGGAETTLIFHEGFDLPYFAAFPLLETSQGRQALRKYYESYLAIAIHAQQGFILESITWRANKDWAKKLGYNRRARAKSNQQAITFLQELRDEFVMPSSPIVISGNIGPRGDGYIVSETMTAEQAKEYHQEQVNTFADTAADMISAFTLAYPDEAIGISLAAQDANIPVAISFTTETDGRLPNGNTLKEAIEAVDHATNNGPAYYMINCAHPDHFKQALDKGESWVSRIRGIRANASRLSHAELDEAEELDRGNPQVFGSDYQKLRSSFPHLNVLGGCCGTDHEHIKAVYHHCCSGTEAA